MVPPLEEIRPKKNCGKHHRDDDISLKEHIGKWFTKQEGVQVPQSNHKARSRAADRARGAKESTRPREGEEFGVSQKKKERTFQEADYTGQFVSCGSGPRGRWRREGRSQKLIHT